MKNINICMLHMKLNSAVSVFAVAAAFSVLLPPSDAYCGICFLPDCQDSDTVQGDINLNINEDSEYCEKKVIPIIHQGNVRNIRRKSVSVPATTTILNVMP